MICAKHSTRNCVYGVCPASININDTAGLNLAPLTPLKRRITTANARAIFNQARFSFLLTTWMITPKKTNVPITSATKIFASLFISINYRYKKGFLYHILFTETKERKYPSYQHGTLEWWVVYDFKLGNDTRHPTPDTRHPTPDTRHTRHAIHTTHNSHDTPRVIPMSDTHINGVNVSLGNSRNEWQIDIWVTNWTHYTLHTTHNTHDTQYTRHTIHTTHNTLQHISLYVVIYEYGVIKKWVSNWEMSK